MKDFDGLVLKILGNREAKEHYILYYLMKKWPEICGSTIAKHSQPQRLEHNVLFINTDNSAWSHNFLMMKRQILNKINKFIPLEKDKKRTLKIKEMKFYQGKIEDIFVKEKEVEAKKEVELSSEEEKNIISQVNKLKNSTLKPIFLKIMEKDKKYKKTLYFYDKHLCSDCGVPLLKNEKYCGPCGRIRRDKLRYKISEIIRSAPWLSYNECLNYVICDKILFSDVKERMQEWAILEAIKPTATENEKYFAVMLDKELTPENISDEIVKKALTVYKRRRTRVFTSGK